MSDITILVPTRHQMVTLLGQRDELLKVVERSFSGANILVRGNEIRIAGEPQDSERVAFLFEELLRLLDAEETLTPEAIERTIDIVKTTELKPSEVLTDAALTHRGKVTRPKTAGQKAYVDEMRRSTVTFGIGPAGTGKTYLAVAMAVRALLDKEVNRLILTRPAVEAGERLGFLPGTLHEKIDPYMRPLFDALTDMMDAEKVQQMMQRGTIEVSPLAFMRGRAQPVDEPVLTPDGWRPIGSLEIGDQVIGSNGEPSYVLGVHPQDRRLVYEVRSQDGASTRACAEHLWAVRTPTDKRRGEPHRVMQTAELAGALRAAHQHRFELPMLGGPVRFPDQRTPIDPYALGLLLGDGCITGSTTPTFATTDPELAHSLETALDAIEVVHKSGPDYVLRHVNGGRGIAVANPVSAAMAQLGLLGTRSATKFVPDVYLFNTPEVRHAVLQGLLDTDGGPVSQAGRTCRVQYTTTSPRLRDDVTFLVRSLGGVTYQRTRAALGRRPGRARGRDVPYRTDAYCLDVRLPEAFAPFRLTRKAQRYARDGGGRPMRFIDSIEPIEETDTVCISVAAEDSLYVTRDFLLTHNTLNGSFIILDEAQNTTPEQMKMFLTRLGFGSKIVVTGDVTQIDLPGQQYSGLNAAREILVGIEGVSFSYLSAKDVVRHRIVQDIVEAYRRFDEGR